jgi:ABC-type branched-subunit amino acid transport system substrate-binding protein
MGTTPPIESLVPLAEQEGCFMAIIGNPRHPGPEAPHFIIGCPDPWYWVQTFWEQAYEFNPGIETVAVVSPISVTGDWYCDSEQDVHARFGSEVVDVARYQQYAVDYYPILTPIVAKNPDVISMSGGTRGDIDLMIKQARELGYTGLLASGNHGDAASAIEVAGCEYSEGFRYNDPDYSSEVYSDTIRQLDAEFKKRFPGRAVFYTTYLGYAFTYFFKQAIELAGSIDTAEVMKVIDDPTWRFEWFGRPGASLGGTELVGINRCINDEVGYSELINCEKVMKSRKSVDIP